jgi:hypothetical protein
MTHIVTDQFQNIILTTVEHTKVFVAVFSFQRRVLLFKTSIKKQESINNLKNVPEYTSAVLKVGICLQGYFVGIIT